MMTHLLSKKSLPVLAALLALVVSGCAIAQANTEGETAGSELVSEQVTPAKEEPSIPEYDPIDLERNNPLGDVEISSVLLRLQGVGELEFENADKQAVLDIAQNDARTWDGINNTEGFGYIQDGLQEVAPYTITLQLGSGEEVMLRAFPANAVIGAKFYINTYRFDLTDKEYETFKALCETYRSKIIDSADETFMPYADLTADDLEKVTRVRHYLDEDQSEQILDDDQVEMVLATLNALEIQPATARFKLELLAGGGYEYFELYFKNGQHYAIGSYQEIDLESEEHESYSLAYIDGVLYRANDDFANEMYWNYEETEAGYKKMYLSAREVAEYPFERLSANEITSICTAYMEGFGTTNREVSLDLADRVVEVLQQIRISDDNKVTVENKIYSIGYQVARTSGIIIKLSNLEQISLGVDNGNLVVNMADYKESPEVIAAVEALIADARASAEELNPTPYETYKVTVDNGSGKGFTFELPTTFVVHSDGYYPDGYTLENTPMSVTIVSYENDNRPSNAPSYLLEQEMEATIGGRYADAPAPTAYGASRLIAHWGDGATPTELVLILEGDITVEIRVYGYDDYEIGPKSLLSFIQESVEAL